MYCKLFTNKYFLALTVPILVTILIKCYNNYKHSNTQLEENEIYSTEMLARFDGLHKERLYLALLGTIFDVTEGRQHYDKGNGYHFFIGKDGSRSFITGNFSDESADRDHVMDLACDDLFIITNWLDTYKKKYIYKGKLIGRYYDKYGKETPYKKELRIKLSNCQVEKTVTDNLNKKYPSCNAEWSPEKGTRVWCSNNSGGVSRSWVGVPRKLFTPGENSPRCVCIDLAKDYPKTRLKTYDNCVKESPTCNLNISD